MGCSRNFDHGTCRLFERELQGAEKSAMAMSIEQTQDGCTLEMYSRSANEKRERALIPTAGNCIVLPRETKQFSIGRCVLAVSLTICGHGFISISAHPLLISKFLP